MERYKEVMVALSESDMKMYVQRQIINLLFLVNKSFTLICMMA